MDFDATAARFDAVGAVALADGFVDGFAVGLAEGLALLPPCALGTDFAIDRVAGLAALLLVGAVLALPLTFDAATALGLGRAFVSGFFAVTFFTGLAAFPGATAPALPFADLVLTC